jgi:hypothetical protein
MPPATVIGGPDGATAGPEAPFREHAAARLDSLRRELRRARDHLDRLDAQRADLADLALRLSGAIQVLSELLGEDEGSAPGRPAG